MLREREKGRKEKEMKEKRKGREGKGRRGEKKGEFTGASRLIIQGQVKAFLITVFRKQRALALSFQGAYSCQLVSLFICLGDKDTCNWSFEMQGYFFIFPGAVCFLFKEQR